jgi:putative transcriptional regulator
MTTHHPHDDLLLSYSAGSLGESWSIAIGTHLVFCPDCRASVNIAEEFGGVILENFEPVPLSDDALHDVLASLDQTFVAKNSHKRAKKLKSFLPKPLENYIVGSPEDIEWRSIGGGVQQLFISTKDLGTARLLKIPAGSAVPEHGHRGRELTLVLNGSYSDSSGQFSAGDIQDVDEETSHKPFAGDESDCICLAVTDSALNFKDIIPRLIQPFINI